MHGTIHQATIESIAKAELASADGDVTAATEAMVIKVKADAALYRQLMDPLVRIACYDEIRAASHRNRQKVWEQPQPSHDARRRGIEELANATLSLYDFPLPGGKALGDAVKPEVSEASSFYMSQAHDMKFKGVFLKLVEKALPDDATTVRDALPISKLNTMKKRAKKNV